MAALNRTFDYSDAPFAYVPENSFTGTVSIMFPLDASVGEVSLTGSVYYQDEMATNEPPPARAINGTAC